MVEERYDPFLVSEPADIVLDVHKDSIPEIDDWAVVFDTGAVWKLFRKGDCFALGLYSAVQGPGPYQVTIFNEDFTNGEMYIDPRKSPLEDLQFPLRYPQAELMMINLLARQRGILFHASAVKLNGKGLLFVGNSGAGKTTLSRLWQQVPGARLLSDDRIILRNKDGQFRVYGTPWHGVLPAKSPESAPLTHIFILNHSPINQALRMEPIQAASNLLVRSFPSYWDREGMDFTLGLLSDLSQNVPCYQLGFVPDQAITDYLACLTA